MVRREGIVLTDDDQMRAYAYSPDEVFTPKAKNTAMGPTSFHAVRDRAVQRHSQIITFFHDHFFGGGERTLHLTHPEFIECTRRMCEDAESVGVGIGASVTNPLDLGRNFRQDIGVGGQHRFFSEGVLNADGSFSFNAMMSDRWCNNKGYTYPEFESARLFAYTEEDDGSPYLVIRPECIREIPPEDYTLTQSDEPWELSGYFRNHHMEVKGRTSLPGNRVFAVFHMNTPEMDYFHPAVTEYVHGIIDMYREKGVEFMELYSDEMHIQFDWDFSHFGPHEIPTRYMTDNFQTVLSGSDELFADFDKALIWFGYDMQADRETLGRKHTQHVIGRTPDALYRTFRMRRTYYETLQDKVVGMCCESRDYIRATYEKHKGWDPLCLGHATWQESPTCDRYADVKLGGHVASFGEVVRQGYCAYDYTPDYVYSSTVREAISGCYDYFKWNDYFSYGGNDFCECGWFDRNYYGGAMACSLGSLNRNEVGSWGAWGFPDWARRRFHAVDVGFGTTRGTQEAVLTYGRPRVIDVLYVYPKDLTSVEERFGSWMVQYAYCNYCPADRIVNLGSVKDGKLYLGTDAYSTIVVGFEPYYNEAFLSLLENFAAQGGTVVWNSTPPADVDGQVPAQWLKLFGLESVQSLVEGGTARNVTFDGMLGSVPAMNILSDSLPDRVYRIGTPNQILAYADGAPVGTGRKVGNGFVCYLGFRLRNDQTGDSGDGPRTLFQVLKTLGAYGGANADDNAETISCTSPFFATKFANDTVSVCNHYYPMREQWEGGFGRNRELDEKALKDYPYMVPVTLDLTDFSVEGHTVTYKGTGAVQFRTNADGALIGFYGNDSTGITVDGKSYTFTEAPAHTLFNELESDRLPAGYTKGWEVVSSAPSVDLNCDIPADAELYNDVMLDGSVLNEDARLSLDGSVLIMQDVWAAIILAK